MQHNTGSPGAVRKQHTGGPYHGVHGRTAAPSPQSPGDSAVDVQQSLHEEQQQAAPMQLGSGDVGHQGGVGMGPPTAEGAAGARGPHDVCAAEGQGTQAELHSPGARKGGAGGGEQQGSAAGRGDQGDASHAAGAQSQAGTSQPLAEAGARGVGGTGGMEGSGGLLGAHGEPTAAPTQQLHATNPSPTSSTGLMPPPPVPGRAGARVSPATAGRAGAAAGGVTEAEACVFMAWYGHFCRQRGMEVRRAVSVNPQIQVDLPSLWLAAARHSSRLRTAESVGAEQQLWRDIAAAIAPVGMPTNYAYWVRLVYQKRLHEFDQVVAECTMYLPRFTSSEELEKAFQEAFKDPSGPPNQLQVSLELDGKSVPAFVLWNEVQAQGGSLKATQQGPKAWGKIAQGVSKALGSSGNKSGALKPAPGVLQAVYASSGLADLEAALAQQQQREAGGAEPANPATSITPGTTPSLLPAGALRAVGTSGAAAAAAAQAEAEAAAAAAAAAAAVAMPSIGPRTGSAGKARATTPGAGVSKGKGSGGGPSAGFSGSGGGIAAAGGGSGITGAVLAAARGAEQAAAAGQGHGHLSQLQPPRPPQPPQPLWNLVAENDDELLADTPASAAAAHAGRPAAGSALPRLPHHQLPAARAPTVSASLVGSPAAGIGMAGIMTAGRGAGSGPAGGAQGLGGGAMYSPIGPPGSLTGGGAPTAGRMDASSGGTPLHAGPQVAGTPAAPAPIARRSIHTPSGSLKHASGGAAGPSTASQGAPSVPAAPAAPQAPPSVANVLLYRRKRPGSHSATPIPKGLEGHNMVGHRLRIYWPLDDAYYKGTITHYTHNADKSYSMLYDDGEREELALAREDWLVASDDEKPLPPRVLERALEAAAQEQLRLARTAASPLSPGSGATPATSPVTSLNMSDRPVTSGYPGTGAGHSTGSQGGSGGATAGTGLLSGRQPGGARHHARGGGRGGGARRRHIIDSGSDGEEEAAVLSAVAAAAARRRSSSGAVNPSAVSATVPSSAPVAPMSYPSQPPGPPRRSSSQLPPLTSFESGEGEVRPLSSGVMGVGPGPGQGLGAAGGVRSGAAEGRSQPAPAPFTTSLLGSMRAATTPHAMLAQPPLQPLSQHVSQLSDEQLLQQQLSTSHAAPATMWRPVSQPEPVMSQPAPGDTELDMELGLAVTTSVAVTPAAATPDGTATAERVVTTALTGASTDAAPSHTVTAPDSVAMTGVPDPLARAVARRLGLLVDEVVREVTGGIEARAVSQPSQLRLSLNRPSPSPPPSQLHLMDSGVEVSQPVSDPAADLPPGIMVTVNGYVGVFLTRDGRIACTCADCHIPEGSALAAAAGTGTGGPTRGRAPLTPGAGGGLGASLAGSLVGGDGEVSVGGAGEEGGPGQVGEGVLQGVQTQGMRTIWSPPSFERHSGRSDSHGKWRQTIRIWPGAGVSLGRWLALRGLGAGPVPLEKSKSVRVPAAELAPIEAAARAYAARLQTTGDPASLPAPSPAYSGSSLPPTSTLPLSPTSPRARGARRGRGGHARRGGAAAAAGAGAGAVVGGGVLAPSTSGDQHLSYASGEQVTRGESVDGREESPEVTLGDVGLSLLASPGSVMKVGKPVTPATAEGGSSGTAAGYPPGYPGDQAWLLGSGPVSGPEDALELLDMPSRPMQMPGPLAAASDRLAGQDAAATGVGNVSGPGGGGGAAAAGTSSGRVAAGGSEGEGARAGKRPRLDDAAAPDNTAPSVTGTDVVGGGDVGGTQAQDGAAATSVGAGLGLAGPHAQAPALDGDGGVRKRPAGGDSRSEDGASRNVRQQVVQGGAGAAVPAHGVSGGQLQAPGAAVTPAGGGSGADGAGAEAGEQARGGGQGAAGEDQETGAEGMEEGEEEDGAAGGQERQQEEDEEEGDGGEEVAAHPGALAPPANPQMYRIQGDGWQALRAEGPPGFEVMTMVAGFMMHELRVRAYDDGVIEVRGVPADPEASSLWGVRPFTRRMELPRDIHAKSAQALLTLHGQLYIRVFDEPPPAPRSQRPEVAAAAAPAATAPHPAHPTQYEQLQLHQEGRLGGRQVQQAQQLVQPQQGRAVAGGAGEMGPPPPPMAHSQKYAHARYQQQQQQQAATAAAHAQATASVEQAQLAASTQQQQQQQQQAHRTVWAA